MKRKLINQLLKWKESSCIKPLLLTGAKGVGKTYLAYDFAKSFYDRSVYINFERDKEVIKFLDNIIANPEKDMLQNFLINHFQIKENTDSILVILDEISYYPNYDKLIQTLLDTKIFASIIAVTSIAISSKAISTIAISSTAVSNDNQESVITEPFVQLQLFPLDFEEFLIAAGIEWYIEVIREHYISNKKIPDIVHKELLSIFELYLQLGGMPHAVNEYIGTGEVFNVSEQHEMLIHSYLGMAAKLKSESEILKINQIISTIEKQLLKENKKFLYTLIRKGATYGLYAEAIEYLSNSFYGLKSYKLADITLENYLSDAYEVSLEPDDAENTKNCSFKFYMLDVGLLNTILKSKENPEEAIKKALYENFAAQSLLANGYPLYFWESNSQAKLDFVILKDNQMIPVEVRTNENTRSKNVSIFRSKFTNVTESIKVSTRNFEFSNQVKYVPIYAMFCI